MNIIDEEQGIFGPRFQKFAALRGKCYGLPGCISHAVRRKTKKWLVLTRSSRWPGGCQPGRRCRLLLGVSLLATVTCLHAGSGKDSGDLFVGEVKESADAEGGSWWSGFRPPSVELDGEALWSDDIALLQNRVTTRWRVNDADLVVGYGYNRFHLDYEPTIVGWARDISLDTHSANGELTWPVTDSLSVVAGGSLYSGFTDYRSLWISEYYRQLFGEADGYVAPDPEGWFFNMGLIWNYLPNTGKLELRFGHGRDTIAPGYDVGADGLTRSRPRLHQKQVSLEQEHILNRRTLMRNRLSWTDLTNREKRWNAQTDLNVILTDSWVLRTTFGGAVEKPQFEALYGGVTLNHEFHPGWHVSLGARLYHDTGEIENSLGGFNTSAPELDTFEVSLGLRWQREWSVWKIQAAYYETDYAELAEDNEFLANLYKNREWGMLQLSYSRQF